MTRLEDPHDHYDLRLDPDRSAFIACFGRKGTGKSTLAESFWDSYPYDRLLIDATGDASRGHDYEPLGDPESWPPDDDDIRQTYVLVPNRLDPACLDEVDRAIGVAYDHHKTLVWIDEIGEVAPANRTRPHMDMALHQGRHVDLSLLMCGPRPVNLDPLVLSQADWVFMFDIPHPLDIDRLAASLGIDRAELTAVIRNLGPHEFAGFDAQAHELTVFPALPL